ncbi:transcription repressor MYB4-like [Rutidosis leptorrhynchoides]|uniref:transcription repressor MYB4-like n=1 Tax=Rutidosis leptorrhynchoides TaxID=125765 RepID=UPI003A9A5ECB
MVRPPCCDKINMRKGSWTEEDDAQMLAFVAKQPTSNWQGETPRKPGLKRCAKSCRSRKTSIAKNEHITHESFTPQEEELIIKLHSAIGSRWPIIAQQLPGRTDIDVKNYWNTKLKKKLSSMGIDPVTHRPFSQMLADYGNISGLTRARTSKNTMFMSNQEIQQVPTETLFPSFNNNVKMEPQEVIKTDSFDLLTQLQAIRHVNDSSTNHDITLTQFHVSMASSSSSSSTCSTVNEMTPQQTFNWRDFLIENVQDGNNVNDEKITFDAIGGIELVKGNTPLINGVKETIEETCDGSFVEAMLDGENDMLLDFHGLLGEPSYY